MNTLQFDIIDLAYSDLYAAFMRHDRRAIIWNCMNCRNIGIPQFHEKANSEMEKIYAMAGIRTSPILTTLESLPDNVLNIYAQACMNVLFNVKMQKFRYDNQYAYQVLSQPTQFHSSDVLYTKSNNHLTVGNFLKVIKYAISIAEIIAPDNKAYSYAGASVLALQGLDDILNNKSNTELTNHTLHVATDFLASSVKESLNDTNAKRNVVISALLVNLAIDFLVKENK